jgi:hypothetical protein
MRWTWEKVSEHRDHRLWHGLYSLLLLTEILAIIGIAFFAVLTPLYVACMLLPNMELFVESIKSNAIDYAFLISFTWFAGAALVLIVEFGYLVRSLIGDDDS